MNWGLQCVGACIAAALIGLSVDLTSYAFDWQMQGIENNVLRPFTSPERETGISPRARARSVQSSLSKIVLQERWQHISSSLRVRPVGHPPDATLTPGRQNHSPRTTPPAQGKGAK